MDLNAEVIWLEIIYPKYRLLLCAVYRPPTANDQFWNKFYQSVEDALNYSPFVLITGDLNVDLLTDRTSKLLDLIRFFDLKNVITEPTRSVKRESPY